MPSLPSPYLGNENPVGRIASYFEKIHLTEQTLITNLDFYAMYRYWCIFFDQNKNVIVEKSVENIMRSRFLQKVFPNSKLVYPMRHPLFTALAVLQTNSTTVDSLDECIEDIIRVYEYLYEDFEKLDTSRVFLVPFIKITDGLYYKSSVGKSLGIDFRIAPAINMRSSGSDAYYLLSYRNQIPMSEHYELKEKYEKRLNKLGFSLELERIDKPICDSNLGRPSSWCNAVLQ